MTRARLSRLFWIGAAALVVVAALIGLTAIVRGRFSDTDLRVMLTLVGSLLAGGTLLAGLALRERTMALATSWVALVAAPTCFALVLYGIWAFRDEDAGHATQVGWSGVLVLVAALLAATARLLAVTPALARLATACGALMASAAVATLVALWQRHAGNGFGKLIAALWVLAGVAFFLVPILRRWLSVRAEADDSRLLASLGDVELIATRIAGRGVDVGDPGLAPGEHLVLRRRTVERG